MPSACLDSSSLAVVAGRLVCAFAHTDTRAAGLTDPPLAPRNETPGRRMTAAPRQMTSQGTANGRFTRAVKQRNLFGAEMAIREMRNLSLIDALDYLDLLGEVKPEKLDQAAVRWHGRL